MRARACSSSWGGRETRAFYFSVCVLSVVSASSGTRTAQEWRGRKQKTQRQIRTIFLRKSRKRRSENSEKPSQNRRKIDEKSLLAGFGRPKPFRGRVGTRSGRAREAPKPGRERSWDAPGEPRAAGRRPRASPGRLPLIRLPQGPRFDSFEFPSFFPSLFSFFFSLPFFIDFLSHFPFFFPSFF